MCAVRSPSYESKKNPAGYFRAFEFLTLRGTNALGDAARLVRRRGSAPGSIIAHEILQNGIIEFGDSYFVDRRSFIVNFAEVTGRTINSLL